MPSTSRRIGRAATALWFPLGLVAAIWLLSASSTSLYFPPASRVLDELVDGLVDGELLSALAYSLSNYAIGMTVAVVLGVGLGVVLGERRALRSALAPLLDFMRALPNVAFVPVFILALGIGAGPKIALIAFGCFWPVLVNTIDGVRSINPAILETAQSFRTPHHLRLSRVVFMGALPQVFAGIRIALSVGVVLMVVSELYGSTQGIGHAILDSGQRFAVAETWAGTVLIGVVGYLISMAFLAVEHAALGWHFHRPRRRRGPARVHQP